MNRARWLARLAVGVTSALGGVASAAPGPLSPAESHACFEVVPGHVVELVAAEPLVFDPVAICWDASGTLFVAEMGDYPLGAGGGRIVRLTDADGDGTIDTRTIVAAGLPFPSGLMAWEDGLLVTAAPDILHLADRDHDGVAETREVILTGFAAGNQQLRVNGLTRGPDGWIYAANGRSGGSVTSPRRPDAPAVSIDRHDLRFRPETGEVEAVAGFSQFGLAFDAAGNRFSNWNTAPIRQVVFPLDVAARHPLAAPPADMEVLEDPLRQNRLFPVGAAPTTFNREPTDAFNASCGLSIDSGSRLVPPGCAYVCEPLLNLVHRRELVPVGVAFEARRPAGEESREFLASRDPWFRPVFTVTGPDGALWICDFYRRWVEHPDFVRADLRAGVEWDEGKDRGRIWRVRPAVDRRERVADATREALASARADARRRLGGAGAGLADVAGRLAEEGDPAIRFDVALAAESLDPTKRAGILARVAATAPTDPWVDRAVVCVAEDAAAGVILALVGGGDADRARPDVLRSLAAVCGRGDPDRESGVLAEVVATADLERAGRLAILAGWLEGRKSVGATDVPDSVAGRPLTDWFAVARDLVAGDGGEDRADALSLLLLDPSADATAVLLGRLAAPIGAEEATRLLRALRGRDPGAVTEGILAAWPAASPAVRRAMLETLAAPSLAPAGLESLAAALEDGVVAPGDVDPEIRRAILTAETIPEALGARFTVLLGGVAGADRGAVVAAVEARLPGGGDGARGRELFVRHCAGCHRSGGFGTRVGPDLAAMEGKSPGQLLEDILDPNRRLTGDYAAVAVVTKDGEAFTGLVSGETASTVQLTLAEGKVETIRRGAIEAVRGTGRSLMPEGFEQALDPRDFADLIEFLVRGGRSESR